MRRGQAKYAKRIVLPDLVPDLKPSIYMGLGLEQRGICQIMMPDLESHLEYQATAEACAFHSSDQGASDSFSLNALFKAGMNFSF